MLGESRNGIIHIERIEVTSIKDAWILIINRGGVKCGCLKYNEQSLLINNSHGSSWKTDAPGRPSYSDVSDCGETQTMFHLMTYGDAPNCTWTDLAFPTLASVNCAKHWEESI